MGYGIHVRNRLEDKVDSCFRSAQPHRYAYERIWKAYIGNNYGLSSSIGKNTPLNEHALFARAMVQYLAAQQPRVLISTDVGPFKQWTEEVEYDVRRIMKSESFGRKQQKFVLSALMYSPGIMKVCADFKRIEAGDGDYVTAPSIYVSNVDFSDFVWETGASSFEDADFVGHKVALSVDDILLNPTFAKIDPDVIWGLAGKPNVNSDRLFFENDDESVPYREKIWVWEIHDRSKNETRTFPVENTQLDLRTEKWTGPDGGPYMFLDFLDVPNHAVGLSPMCILHDLHVATNRILSKSIQQGEYAKQVLITSNNDRSEAEALMQSTDGQGVFVDRAGGAQMLNYGGPDRATLGMVPILKDLYSYAGGGMDSLAGLGVQAPTATQERLLADSASQMVKFMQARTVEAVNKAAEHLVWYSLTDRVHTQRIPKKLNNRLSTFRTYGPEEREFLNAALLQADIDVYSLQYRSPQDRLGMLNQWWNTVALPGYQIAQMQGMEYDFQAFNRAYAKLADLSEINDIAIYSMAPQPQLTGSGPMPLRQSPNTTRTSVRMDRGGPSQELGGATAQALLSAA